MNTRRKFLKTAGKGIAFSTIASTSSVSFASQLMAEEIKPLIVGVIGAENSHTIGFGRMFNIRKEFSGIELKYVWGETKEFAENAAEKGQIPVIVKDPLEMLGKIDALIVDHRHPQYHLEALEKSSFSENWVDVEKVD